MHPSLGLPARGSMHFLNANHSGDDDDHDVDTHDLRNLFIGIGGSWPPRCTQRREVIEQNDAPPQ